MAKEYTTPEINIIEEGGSSNTRLPYGLAKGRGIDTKGMTPRQVWSVLKGEGVDPKEEYKKLKERGDKKESSGALSRKDIEDWGNKNNVSFSALYSSFPEDKANEQANRIVELYKEFPVLPKSGNKITVGVEKMSNNTVAQARFSWKNDTIGVAYNEKEFLNIDENEIEKLISQGWWSNTAPENYKYQTINHEYGHMVEYAVLSKLGYKEEMQKKVDELYQKAMGNWSIARRYQSELKKIATETRFSMFYNKVFPEIFRKAKEYDESISIPKKMTKKGYETAPNVSTYGATSWAEYFAESFANGVGGAPTAIGKATVDTIKDIFGGKLL